MNLQPAPVPFADFFHPKNAFQTAETSDEARKGAVVIPMISGRKLTSKRIGKNMTFNIDRAAAPQRERKTVSHVDKANRDAIKASRRAGKDVRDAIIRSVAADFYSNMTLHGRASALSRDLIEIAVVQNQIIETSPRRNALLRILRQCNGRPPSFSQLKNILAGSRNPQSNQRTLK